MRRLCLGLVALAIALACSDSSGPSTTSPRTTAQLHFVTQAQTAPPLLSDSVSFYAIMGQDREVRMYYEGTPPGTQGEQFLSFKVPGDGLLRRPDGTVFQAGDSILITIKVVDPTKFLFDFQPTGLTFSPEHPAELSLVYAHSDHDFNGDGLVDTADAEIETQLDIWQRHPPDTLWYRLGAANYEAYEELDVKIQHFSDHAIAW